MIFLAVETGDGARPRRVHLLHQISDNLEILAGLVFIADGPGDDGRMILVAANRFTRPLFESRSRLGVVGGAPTIGQLVHDIDSQLIAKIVEARAVGTMAGA